MMGLRRACVPLSDNFLNIFWNAGACVSRRMCVCVCVCGCVSVCVLASSQRFSYVYAFARDSRASSSCFFSNTIRNLILVANRCKLYQSYRGQLKSQSAGFLSTPLDTIGIGALTLGFNCRVLEQEYFQDKCTYIFILLLCECTCMHLVRV